MTAKSGEVADRSETFRKGGVGAMMDEYERAMAELSELLRRITDDEFELVRDRQTQDESCRSIQTVIHHVIRAGYGYAGYIREAFAIEAKRPDVPLPTRLESLDQLDGMLAYTTATLEGKWELSDEQITAVQMRSRWGVTYDLEQLLEHAIVHVLRHRRQIERFLIEPRFSGKAAS
jgi:uncharacterized damage-inducible protein DinB